MRINVYTEELLPAGGPNDPIMAEVMTAKYVSSRTGEPMTNYGLRIYLKSAPELHYIPGRDDDRSAVTIWCGSKEKNVLAFLEAVCDQVNYSTLKSWRAKTEAVQREAEAAI